MVPSVKKAILQIYFITVTQYGVVGVGMDSLTLSSPPMPINDHLKTKKEIFARNAEVDPLAFAIFSAVPMANRAHLHPPQADIWS